LTSVEVRSSIRRVRPRITIDLDPIVLAELQQRCRDRCETLGQVASEILAKALAEPCAPSPILAWTSGHLGIPRVDMEDRDAVRLAAVPFDGIDVRDPFR
jgi:hypothetical protein